MAGGTRGRAGGHRAGPAARGCGEAHSYYHSCSAPPLLTPSQQLAACPARGWAHSPPPCPIPLTRAGHSPLLGGEAAQSSLPPGSLLPIQAPAQATQAPWAWPCPPVSKARLTLACPRRLHRGATAPVLGADSPDPSGLRRGAAGPRCDAGPHGEVSARAEKRACAWGHVCGEQGAGEGGGLWRRPGALVQSQHGCSLLTASPIAECGSSSCPRCPTPVRPSTSSSTPTRATSR